MSTPRDLARLIARYRFLQAEQKGQAASHTPSGVAVASALDDVFLQILRYQADEPAISCRQIEFMLTVLADGEADPDVRRMITAEALVHIRRLAEQATPAASATPRKSIRPTPEKVRLSS